MNFTQPEVAASSLFENPMLVVPLIVGAVGLTVLMFFRWKRKLSTGEVLLITAMLLFLALFLSWMTSMALNARGRDSASPDTSVMVQTEVERVYGLDVSPAVVSDLLLVEDVQVETETLANGFGANEVRRFGETELLVDGDQQMVQLVWKGEWILAESSRTGATAVELPRVDQNS